MVEGARRISVASDKIHPPQSHALTAQSMTRPISLNASGAAVFHGATELRRLRSGLRQGEFVQGLCVDVFDAVTDLPPRQLVERVHDVMLRVVTRSIPELWPSDEEWPDLLPDWFVEACAPKKSHEEFMQEEQRLKSLSPEEQMAEARIEKWELGGWTYWMAPEERWWLWWDAGVSDDGTAIFGIDRLEDWYPELPGEFVWMLKACGATDVDSFASERHTVPFPM